jgi:hypothetical protein
MLGDWRRRSNALCNLCHLIRTCGLSHHTGSEYALVAFVSTSPTNPTSNTDRSAVTSSHKLMAFSGAVKIGDLNDFIAPSQACVVSLQGQKHPQQVGGFVTRRRCCW